jgi:hypothetical protein
VHSFRYVDDSFRGINYATGYVMHHLRRTM